MERRTFSYNQALELFPVVRELTEHAVREVQALLAGLSSPGEGPGAMESRRAEIEAAHQEIVAAWADQVTSLGCEVKGLWLVDWDSGDGYFCWRYPEPGLGHFHGYEEGFAGRVPVA